jgi:hypothetical protein
MMKRTFHSRGIGFTQLAIGLLLQTIVLIVVMLRK